MPVPVTLGTLVVSPTPGCEGTVPVPVIPGTAVVPPTTVFEVSVPVPVTLFVVNFVCFVGFVVPSSFVVVSRNVGVSGLDLGFDGPEKFKYILTKIIPQIHFFLRF